MNAVEWFMVVLFLVCLAAIFCLILEPRLERWHRQREARRWAERVARDAEIISQRDKHGRNMDKLAHILACDALAAMVEREGQDRQLVNVNGVKTWIPKGPAPEPYSYSGPGWTRGGSLTRPPPPPPAPPARMVKGDCIPPDILARREIAAVERKRAALFMPPAELGQW
jgi:hypothetical protein